MKKILYILTIALVLPVFSSCDDLLEEKNYGNPTVEEMMSNPDNVGLLVGQIYADLKWVHDHWGYWGVTTLTSDEGLMPTRYPGEDWLDGGYWKNLNSHKWNERGEAFQNIWNTTISAAILCNKLIETLNKYEDSMDETTLKKYIGELETMRSYYYYLLFDCFGRIPYLETFTEAESQPLSSPEEVWSKLVMCLEKNAPNMAKVTSDAERKVYYGRVTQGFAYSLLARLYLNAESFGCTPESIKITDEFYTANPSVTRIAGSNDFYTNAVRCCDAVIDGKGYSIEPNFFNNFKINNENSKENIFVIVENGLEGEDERSNGKMSNKLRIVALTMHYSHQVAWNMMEKPWNGMCARPSFMKLYKGDATNGYDVRGAGPDLPEGMPVPPYVMEQKDLEKETGKKYSETEYKAYRQKMLKDYQDALNTGEECYAVKAKDFGTNSKQQWGWFIGPVFDAAGKIVIDDKDFGAVITKNMKFDATKEDNNRCDGARMYKYEVDKAGAVKWAENDFVLMRYADVLWMKEEAIMRGGIGTSGRGTDDFKTMLKRSFATNTSDPEAAFKAAYGDVNSWTLDDVLDERGREFAWELVRRRDLIRYNKYHLVEFVSATDKYRNWFPIPYSVLQKSLKDENGNSIWTQNEGYVASSAL